MHDHLPVRQIYRNPIYFLAHGFGSGLVPRAPGTAGTLVGVILFVLLTPVPVWLYWLITALLFVLGIFICGYTARALGVEDPGAVNWDEVVGYLITMAVMPHALLERGGWLWIVLGFALFRVFDILKPWPIRWFDRNIGGGIGIMLDDLVAAIPSAVVLYILRLAFPAW
ncbi:MAG TPA: phosphatidylglycerophosphatase A [Gammaproteobacteria bacterium]|nr:phosphatidylglycerophosphatase A [Gammaproteobacteria bacterium]